MSQRVVSLLDPTSARAMAVVLERRAYVRELALCCLSSLVLPLACLIGLYLYSRGADLLGVAIGTVMAAAIIGVPVLGYASLRVNAACLARERGLDRATGDRVYRPLRGPIGFANTIVAGSSRSRTIAALPATLGVLMVLTVMSFVTSGTLFHIVHLPFGLIMIFQAAVASSLMR